MRKKKKFWKVRNKAGFESVVKSNKMPTFSDGYVSISSSYDTIEDLMDDQGILYTPCKECGGLVSTKTKIAERLIEKHICSSCDHWDELSKTIADPRRVIVKGVCYYASERQDGDKRWLGFGGAEWRIRFNDGRYIETNNLWCQGDIAEHYKERMPNNAVFE